MQIKTIAAIGLALFIAACYAIRYYNSKRK